MPLRHNPRRTKLLKLLAQNLTLTAAAEKAGYSCKQAAHRALSDAKGKFSEVMELHGLTDSAIIYDYLLPAMQAEETKFFAHEGEVVSERNVIAWGVRVNALALAAKLKGLVVEHVDHTGLEGLADRIRDGRTRAGTKFEAEDERQS